MRDRRDVVDDLRRLAETDDDEVAVLIFEAIDHLEASILASEILAGKTGEN